MPTASKPLRALVINPNTSTWVTDALIAQLRIAAGTDRPIEFEPVTGTFGASYIASETAYTVAGYACLDCFAARYDAHDVVLIGCFGDPALGALKELSPVPVIGMAEAAMLEAAREGRFSIVTGGRAWQPMLEQLARALGFGDTLDNVLVVEQSAGELAKNRDQALDVLGTLCDRARTSGSTNIILGGAAFAGFGDELAQRTGLPVIDSVSALARSLRDFSVIETKTRSLLRPPSDASYSGLSKALADRLRDIGVES